MFIIVPGYVMGLSFIDENNIGVYVGFFPLVIFGVFIVLINIIQDKRPKWLPKWLRNWDFLPLWMRSFDPLDRCASVISILKFKESARIILIRLE
jgi:sodium-dependent phosphate cotransporter